MRGEENDTRRTNRGPNAGNFYKRLSARPCQENAFIRLSTMCKRHCFPHLQMSRQIWRDVATCPKSGLWDILQNREGNLRCGLCTAQLLNLEGLEYRLTSLNWSHGPVLSEVFNHDALARSKVYIVFKCHL